MQDRGDEAELPDGLCRPLRILGDLYFESEESPGNVELTEVPNVSDTYTPGLTDEEEVQLREYIRSHPRLTEEREAELQIDLSNTAEADGTSLQDLLGGEESQFSSELDDILQNWGTETDHDEIARVPGHGESIREFHGHPRTVYWFGVPDGMLTYRVEDFELEDSGVWRCSVVDGRRDDSTDFDLFFYLSPTDAYEAVTQMGTVADEQFISWEVLVDGEDVTRGVQDVEGVGGAQFHRTLHDKAALLIAVEHFVADLDNASIGPPASWTR